MRPDSKLALKISSKEFLFTSEYRSPKGIEIKIDPEIFRGATAVNAADNHDGVTMSSLAVSLALRQSGIEPVLQITTRDRNRIALQSDLLGASFLGIKNVLCLSGNHQTITGCKEPANVFDIDSIQLIDIVKKMNNGELSDGRRFGGPFNMLIGAAANPYMKPLELNIIRLRKKIIAGADFIQTQPVFDIDGFKSWLGAVSDAGLDGKAAIIAGVMPLTGAAQARELAETRTDFSIPESVVERMAESGDMEAQRKEGIKIASEVIEKIKILPGLKGIHIHSGGNEPALRALLATVK